MTELADRMAKLEHENKQLKKALFGKRSERGKLPRVKTSAPATAEQKTATRRARAEAKAQTPILRVEHKVPDALRRCTACNTDLKAMGPGNSTFVWVRVSPIARRTEGRREGPVRSELSRAPRGGEVRRPSTDLSIGEGIRSKRSADRQRDIVLADETRLRVLKDASGKPKTGFVWTFGASDAKGGFDVAYQFTDSRSGSTPKALLEGTKGVLLVDGYTATADTTTSRRSRAVDARHASRTCVATSSTL